LGLSISKYGKALADYKARGFSFPLNKDLLGAYAAWESARLDWQSFRDSHRVSGEAREIPTGLASALLEEESQEKSE
jgi:hypothetical protein